MIHGETLVRYEGIFIGIGSNMMDRTGMISKAADMLSRHPRITLLTGASLYESRAVGSVQQADFINTVVAVETTLDAHALLTACLEIESGLGRTRTVPGGPRLIDLDLLYYDQRVMKMDGFILPHPEIRHRRFVLDPLLEIAPNFFCPRQQISISAIPKPADQHIRPIKGWDEWWTRTHSMN